MKIKEICLLKTKNVKNQIYMISAFYQNQKPYLLAIETTRKNIKTVLESSLNDLLELNSSLIFLEDLTPLKNEENNWINDFDFEETNVEYFFKCLDYKLLQDVVINTKHLNNISFKNAIVTINPDTIDERLSETIKNNHKKYLTYTEEEIREEESKIIQNIVNEEAEKNINKLKDSLKSNYILPIEINDII